MKKIREFLKEWLPLFFVILGLSGLLYCAFYTNENHNTVDNHDHDNVVVNENVVSSKKHDGQCVKVVDIKSTDDTLKIDTINTTIKYVDNNNNEVKFIGDIKKDDSGKNYIEVQYTKDDNVVSENKYVDNKVTKTDTKLDECVCDNQSITQSNNNNKVTNSQGNTNSGKTNTPSNSNSNNNQSTGNKQNQNQSTNTGNQNNNSGSSNNGSVNNNNNSNQQKGHWEDRQVLVKGAWTENVLVKEAYDETVQVCVKEGYYESVLISGGETTQTCAHYDYPYTAIHICNQCGYTSLQGDISSHVANSDTCGSWHDDWIPDTSAEPVCVVWNTVTTEPVYNNIWHEPVYETQTVHHDAEYKTVYHEAEYCTERVWVND